MVIISYYLKVCLSPGFPLARSPGHRPRGPSGLLACFLLLLLSQCVNELSVPRPPQEPSPPASALPRPGLPAVPVIPSFRLGVQKYIFFPNRQTFSEKFFEIFKRQRSLLPAYHSYTPIKEMRPDASP